MSVNKEIYLNIINQLRHQQVSLVAVSKLKPSLDIQVLYNLGQKDFGENYVQEMIEKADALPKDIRWHFIGHLQSNKVKYIAPFVHLIHSMDSEKLLIEINKQAAKNNRTINCLMQVHIASEETKFGFDADEAIVLADKIIEKKIITSNVNICGLMGMASFTYDMQKVKSEFETLSSLYHHLKNKISSFNILSMGMSADYQLAIDCGSNLVRIGSLLFGARA